MLGSPAILDLSRADNRRLRSSSILARSTESIESRAIEFLLVSFSLKVSKAVFRSGKRFRPVEPGVFLSNALQRRSDGPIVTCCVGPLDALCRSCARPATD